MGTCETKQPVEDAPLYGGVDVISEDDDAELADLKNKNSSNPVRNSTSRSSSLSDIDSTSEDAHMDNSSRNTFVKLGLYILIIVNCVLRILATVSSQMVKTLIPVLELNLLRFLLLLLIGSVTVVVRKISPKLLSFDYINAGLCGFMLFVYMVCYYRSVQYAPVGNILATTTISAVFALFVVKLLRRSFSAGMLLAILTGACGLVFLAQPTLIFPDPRNHPIIATSTCPCATLDETGQGHYNETYIRNQLARYPDRCEYAELSLLDISQWVGYLLATIAGIFLTLCSLIVADLKERYSCPVIFFWTGLFGSIYAVLVFIPAQQSLIYAQGYCLIFSILHAIAATVHPALVMALHDKVPEDHTALISIISMVFPFSSQTTYLSGYIPWTWDKYSAFGLVLIFSGLLFLPLWNLSETTFGWICNHTKSSKEKEGKTSYVRFEDELNLNQDKNGLDTKMKAVFETLKYRFWHSKEERKWGIKLGLIGNSETERLIGVK